jgi:hypothetical protein
MRQYLALAATFTLAAGAAHAQFFQHPGPYHPREPLDPAAAAKAWAVPEPPKPTGPPQMPASMPAPKPFEPFKPMKHVNPDEGSSGLYPELHPKPKHQTNGGF